MKKTSNPRRYGSTAEDTAMVNGVSIQRVIYRPDGTVRGFYMFGWPGVIPMGAMVSGEPRRGRALYGPEARRLARELMAETERLHQRKARPMGWATLTALRSVATGKQPLTIKVVREARRWIERQHAQLSGKPAPANTMRLDFSGSGVGLTLR